jgi:hypothetical protein
MLHVTVPPLSGGLLRSSFLLSLSLLAAHLLALRDRGPAVPPDPGRPLTRDAALLAAIQVDGLTLIPITATSPGDPMRDALVLDEAMTAGLLAIREVDGGQVNELELENRSGRPVFVLAGEVVLGGRQDRIIAANALIPPHASQHLPVFCVEHGRWSGGSNEFHTAGALAHNRLRGMANYDAQGDVWNEVRARNELRHTASATGTYRTLAERQRDGSLAEWERRIDDALDEVPAAERARMIGYVVALDGAIATIDLFRSPSLFARLERKLIRSYVAEAADLRRLDPARVTGAARVPSAAEILAFMADADGAAEERQYVTGASATRIKRGATTGTSSVELGGGRHLYSNYLGNAPRSHERPPYPSYLGMHPGGQGRNPYPSYLGQPVTDRHLYPGYLGNNPHADRHLYPNGPGRQPSQPPCERDRYSGYIGNQPLCKSPSRQPPRRLRRTTEP